MLQPVVQQVSAGRRRGSVVVQGAPRWMRKMGRNYNCGNDVEAERSHRRAAESVLCSLVAGVLASQAVRERAGQAGQSRKASATQCRRPARRPTTGRIAQGGPERHAYRRQQRLGRTRSRRRRHPAATSTSARARSCSRRMVTSMRTAQHQVRGDVEYLDPQLRAGSGLLRRPGIGQFEGAEFELLDQSVAAPPNANLLATARST